LRFRRDCSRAEKNNVETIGLKLAFQPITFIYWLDIHGDDNRDRTFDHRAARQRSGSSRRNG